MRLLLFVFLFNAFCGFSQLSVADFTLNLNRGDGRVQYSLGISHADYVYASRYTIDSLGGQFTMDPQGWYLTFGPHAMVNVVINEFLLAEFSGGYGFTYEHPINLSYAYKPSISYPNPGFGNVKLELDSKWGFYACAQYNWIHNKGPLPSAGKRLDLFLGFRFMLEKSS